MLNILDLILKTEEPMLPPTSEDRVVVVGKKFILKRDFDIWEITFGNKNFQVQPTTKEALEKEKDLGWRVMMCLDLFDGKTHCIEPSDLLRLKRWQKVSRLYGLRKTLWNKDSFCATMSAALRGFNGEMEEFVFPCWLLPRDFDTLIAEAQTKYKNRAFILKPTDRGEGNGILVFDNYRKLPNWKADFPDNDEVVVQTYLPNPLLVTQRKWDMRTYVLVTSIHPLRVYMYRDGLIRFASTKYTKANAQKKTAFLTNTSINKKFAAVDDLTWPFPKMYHYFKENGIDADLLWMRIERAVVRLLLSAEPEFLRTFKALQNGFTCDVCYQLLGVDVIVDDTLVPRVIELNGEPSMQLTGEKGSHYDHTKTSMTRDLANLLYTRKSFAKAVTEDLYNLELDGYKVGYQAFGCETDDDICLRSVDLQYLVDMKKEEQQMGGFRRMYPHKDGDVYTEYLKHLETKLPYGTVTSTHRIHNLVTTLAKRSTIVSDNSVENPEALSRLMGTPDVDEEET